MRTHVRAPTGILRKGPFMCLQSVTGKSRVGGRTKSRGSGRREEAVEAQSLCSCPGPGMAGGAGRAGVLVRHELPMVNGELALPEVSLLRCPCE